MSKLLNTKVLFLLGLGTLIAFSTPAAAQVEATAEWGAPTTGTPVDHYVLQLSVNGGTWTTIAQPTQTEYTLTVTLGDSHRVRVAGVDAEGRQGPFSLPSDAYAPGDPDPGPPGAPGDPIPF